MSEWFKEHAWKVCILQKGIEGSNPSLSAKYQSKCLDESRGIFHLQMSQACLSEIKQMKNEGGEATEAFTRYFAGLP